MRGSDTEFRSADNVRSYARSHSQKKYWKSILTYNDSADIGSTRGFQLGLPIGVARIFAAGGNHWRGVLLRFGILEWVGSVEGL